MKKPDLLDDDALGSVTGGQDSPIGHGGGTPPITGPGPKAPGPSSDPGPFKEPGLPRPNPWPLPG